MGLCVKKKDKDEGRGCVCRIVIDNLIEIQKREENSFKIYPLGPFLVSAKIFFFVEYESKTFSRFLPYNKYSKRRK